MQLRNLFAYISELYNTQEAVPRFDNEPHNPKSRNAQYFALQDLLDLQAESRQRAIVDLTIQTLEVPEKPLLTLRRVAIGELLVPETLKNWVIIPKYMAEKPTELYKKAQIEHHNADFRRNPHRAVAFEEWIRGDWQNMPIPEILQNWVLLPPANGQDLPTKVASGRDIELFDDSPYRETEVARFAAHYIRYYDVYWQPLLLNRLFDALHALIFDLKGKNSKRLYLSFGLIEGKIGGVEYQNFLFHVPMRLSLKNQSILIEADNFGQRIFAEQSFVDLLRYHFPTETDEMIEQRKYTVLSAIDEFNNAPQEFFFDAPFLFQEYLPIALKVISVFPNMRNEWLTSETDALDFSFKNGNENDLRFSFSPILQTKIVESEILISKDAANIIKQIEILEKEEHTTEIPDFFKKLFINNDTISLNSSVNLSETHKATDFLFPLPYNEEQLAIAERLNVDDAVTVKGPPGTGKSHTIANLIANFVAQGKNVLVVSQNAQALAVVKEKLPNDLRELTVSLVNERNTEGLKQSVKTIITNLSRVYSPADLQRKQDDLNNAAADYTVTLNEVTYAIGGNTRTLAIQGVSRTALEWATDLAAQPAPRFPITDDLPSARNTDDWSVGLMQIVRFTDTLTAADLHYANYTFVKDEEWLSPNDFGAQIELINTFRDNAKMESYAKVEPDTLTEDFLADIAAANAEYEELENEQPQVLQVFNNAYFDGEQLQEIVDIQVNARTNNAETNKLLLTYAVDFTPIIGVEMGEVRRSAADLLEIFGDDDQLSFFDKFKLTATHKLLMDCELNDAICDRKSKIAILLQVLNFANSLKNQQILLKNYYAQLGLEPPVSAVTLVADAQQFRFVYTKIEKAWANLQTVLLLHHKIKTINNLLRVRKMSPALPAQADFAAKWAAIVGLAAYKTYREAAQNLSLRKQKILSVAAQPPSALRAADALVDLDLRTYTEQIEEYKAARARAQAVQRYMTALNALRKIMPLTADALHTTAMENGAELRTMTEMHWTEAINQAKIRNFIVESAADANKVNALLIHLDALRREIERKTSDLVAFQTWFKKAAITTDHQKSALTAWLNDLTNIGRGYGKNTARNRASAIQNMQLAKGAVPIWIMQQTNAISFFPEPLPNQFDVLIVDEASQCDLSTLNLVFRAKKTVIVGDENQTAVTIDNAKFGIDRVNALLDRYFLDHPFKQQFNLYNKNNSIYSLSSVIYPNIITLVEHFRCLPEIIGFSNKYVYHNSIVPLRTSTDNSYGIPVSIIYAPTEGENNEEKPEIVAAIVAQIMDLIQRYEKKKLAKLPSIGVISLDSSNKKHQALLVSELTRNARIIPFMDMLNLVVGTSREFQGDERDLMFLTTTAAPMLTADGDLRAPRAVASEEYMRIYNVAASRAKLKSVVVHSLPPDVFGTLPQDCYRAKLLRYYTQTQKELESNVVQKTTLNDILQKTDAQNAAIELPVATFLHEKGYAPFLHPQFRIGKYVVDFAIIKDGKKLAVECDSKHADVSQQIVLQRAGWQFYRLQAIAWSSDMEQTKAELMSFLEAALG